MGFVSVGSTPACQVVVLAMFNARSTLESSWLGIDGPGDLAIVVVYVRSLRWCWWMQWWPTPTLGPLWALVMGADGPGWRRDGGVGKETYNM